VEAVPSTVAFPRCLAQQRAGTHSGRERAVADENRRTGASERAPGRRWGRLWERGRRCGNARAPAGSQKTKTAIKTATGAPCGTLRGIRDGVLAAVWCCAVLYSRV
jgi:hypothetical protein